MGCFSRVAGSFGFQLLGWDINALASPFPEDLKENALICGMLTWISGLDLGIPIAGFGSFGDLRPWAYELGLVVGTWKWVWDQSRLEDSIFFSY